MVSLSLPPLLCEIGDIKGEGVIGRGIYSLTCVDIFSPPPLFYLPLCQSQRPLTFPFSHSLAYIWAFSETCSTTTWCMNSRGLCTYCQANQGALQLKYCFGQRRVNSPGRVRERYSAAQWKCWDYDRSQFLLPVICMSLVTFPPCLLPHTTCLSFIRILL